MPELPEVEAIVSRLKPEVMGRQITLVEVLREGSVKPQTPAEVARLATGRRIQQVTRRGKNILIALDRGLSVRVHLRLTGELHTGGAGKFTRLVFHLSGRRQLVFDDARVLGRVNVLTEAETAKALAALGPEPLSRDFKPEPFLAAAKRSKLAAKLFLMSQKHVAGLGNIYAAEALFQAGIDPGKPIAKVSREKLKALHLAIRTVLRGAAKSAKIAYNRPGKYKEAAGFRRAVYGREGEPCLRCAAKIRRIEQAGRSTYFCARCQR
jgi:formamidopyrimidine-DNA glycosylase